MSGRVFVTSDTHFGHKNIITYDGRPFDNVWHMRTELIRRWNEVVQPEDTVYHLGDVAFAAPGATREIVGQLNGHKVLIRGNHDGPPTRAARLGFAAVHDDLHVHTDAGEVLLVHSPTGRADHDFDGLVRPSDVRTVVHGHVHTRWKVRLDAGWRYVNAGCMWWDYRPQPLDVVLGA